MNDVTALVALISTSGTVLVALIAALGSVFGERWRDRRAVKEERERSGESARYLAVQTFGGSLLRLTQRYHSDEDSLRCQAMRVDFVATLRPGEGDVARFASELARAVTDSADEEVAMSTATNGIDQLFAWLRGELRSSGLVIAASRSVVAD